MGSKISGPPSEWHAKMALKLQEGEYVRLEQMGQPVVEAKVVEWVRKGEHIEVLLQIVGEESTLDVVVTVGAYDAVWFREPRPIELHRDSPEQVAIEQDLIARLTDQTDDDGVI